MFQLVFLRSGCITQYKADLSNIKYTDRKRKYEAGAIIKLDNYSQQNNFIQLNLVKPINGSKTGYIPIDYLASGDVEINSVLCCEGAVVAYK